VTSEELAAIRARVEIADRDDSYLRSYTGASNADLYRHPQVRADMRALLAEVARLTAEVERLSAMVPRWAYTHRGRMWRLYCCGVRLLDSGLSAFPGELVLDTTTGDEYPDLPTACRSVCARLGLHDIKPPEGA
jgi:hypothetical protein